MSEPEGRGAAWTEERRRSDEGRQHLKGAQEASGGTLSTWHDLVTASLIGTERAVVPAVAIPGLPPAEDDTGDPAAVLLDRAALLTAARRAGRRPDRAEPLPVCDPDPRPAVSPAAADRLARILGGEYPELLTEWLTELVARDLRLPPQFLPVLLDGASRGRSKDSAFPHLVAEAGGSRARWLMELNPNWESVLPETLTGDEAWRLGTTSQRRAYLAALRSRDPGAARELIAGSWAAAGPEERVMFVKVMARGLGPADEPLLETALHDGTAWVRAMAADVLAALPESALSRQMTERAVQWLRIRHDKHGPYLAVVAPDDARLLIQAVGLTPLRTWTDAFGLTAAQIVALRSGDWAAVLFTAWVRAAIAQRDGEWTAALIGQALVARLPAAAIQTLGQLVRQADPALGAPDTLPEPGPDTPSAVGAALRVLRFRYEMLKELDGDHDG
jgi:hypothetical protein